MAWRLAVDIGGTFTDVVALEEESGELHLAKVPSTPDDPANGFIDGIERIRSASGVAAADIAAVFHGTTVATNVILQRKYSPLGLITTRGFREVLEVARQTVPGEFGDITWWIKPERVVPLERIREARGRLNVAGEETEAVDEAEVRAIANEFKSMGVTAIAVSLLH
jgi:N-methylhydantoinase A